MKRIFRVAHQLTALVVLTLAVPAAYGAAPAEHTPAAADVQVGRLLQWDADDGWTPGANVTRAEGDAVRFGLELEARSGGTYVVTIEYTKTLTKQGITADGYTGIDVLGVESDVASVVTDGITAAEASTGTPSETTEKRSVTLDVAETGSFLLEWVGHLGVTSDGRWGPGAISGAQVHMRHLASNRTVAIRVAPVESGDLDTCSGFCDEIEPCTGDDCGGECTGDDCGGACTGDDCGGACTGDDCGGECTGDGCGPIIIIEDDGPSCTGDVAVNTVDVTGKRVGPSEALVGDVELALEDGRGESVASCGEIVVALTAVPQGFRVTGGSAVVTDLRAASTHLATQTAQVDSGSITEVTFVLAATADEGESEVEDEVVVDDRNEEADVEPVTETVDDDRPTTGPGDTDLLPAPARSGDDGADRTGSTDDTAVVAAVDELPRTGTDAPLLLLVASALLAAGAATLRVTRPGTRASS